jgi:hypothetical protein
MTSPRPEHTPILEPLQEVVRLEPIYIKIGLDLESDLRVARALKDEVGDSAPSAPTQSKRGRALSSMMSSMDTARYLQRHLCHRMCRFQVADADL